MSPYGPSVWTGRALQAESDDLEKLVLRICIRPIHGAFELLAIMDIRARSISFASRPRRPEGPPDHERAGETFLHLLILTRRPWWEKPTQKLFWISALGRRLGDAGFITALLSQSRRSVPACWRERRPKRWGGGAERRARARPRSRASASLPAVAE